MYGYEYEYDILALLRVLKYVHLYRADEFANILEYYHNMEPDEVARGVAWDAFDHIEGEIDEEWGNEIIYVYDKLLNRYFELNLERTQSGNLLRWETVRKRLLHMACYYLLSATNEIIDIDVLYSVSGISLVLTMSQDCMEPFELANAVVDFLLALRQEIAVLEARMNPRPAEITEFPQNTLEEAA